MIDSGNVLRYSANARNVLRMTTSRTATEARKAELFARTSTPTLIQSALMLEALTERSNEERMTLAWIDGEIERRCGGVQDEDAFLALMSQTGSTVLALIATFPELVA